MFIIFFPIRLFFKMYLRTLLYIKLIVAAKVGIYFGKYKSFADKLITFNIS